MKCFKKDKDKKGQFIFSDYITEYALIFLLFALVSPIVGIFIVKVLKLGSYIKGEPTGDVFTNLGVYGDFLGGSTLPFLTLITIAFVYKTFNLQEEQLRIQKEENVATRATLAEQNKTAQLQRFENSFFIQLQHLKEKQKINIGPKNLSLEIILDTHTLILKMKTHEEEHWGESRDAPNRDIEWMLYKAEMQRLFELNKLIFSNSNFKNYIYSIMRCFQLLNKYKGIMDNDEVRYYLRYIIDEIGEESYRLSMLYIIVYSEMHADFFKAIKDLKLHTFVTMGDNQFDRDLLSSLFFISTVLGSSASDH
ncbi:hypothetical protein Q8G35_25850 [Peribacillus simplex]|uniref:Phage abortive infection protein n=2 Tax=Peribacillus TaxID=2675229 RepID=A0AA90P8K3_9BACI|nr:MULTISPECIES: hypothetical protein [Peribacillus]MDP1421695.1 hypothetical protein [Peribacillus simplex]MDP1454381.1 hypothetical protein [Peribacillus frigoritolerans]